MEQWEIARSTGVCAASGRQLAEGEEHFAVLYEAGETFRREDFSLEAWQGPPADCFCFFKTTVPVKARKKRLLVDDDVLLNFFTRLAEEKQESRVHFRFVLALILMRKRILKYEQTLRENGAERWIMKLVRDQSLHHVINPQLNDEQIERVSHELGAILHGDMGDFDELPAEQAADDDAPATESPKGVAVEGDEP